MILEEDIQFERLYIEYRRDIYQFSLYITGKEQDAEDITQETFLKAMRNLASLRDPTRAKFWLLSIARHAAYDHIRKRKVSSLIPNLITKISSNDKEKPLEDHILLKEKWEEIQDSLLKLKPHYRSLLILRGIQELTIKETAEVLNCTELKVRVDFHRAVKILKKEINLLEEAVMMSEKNRSFNSRS